MKYIPDDVQALVISKILSMTKGSPESIAAFREYQATRVLKVRPKLLAQKNLLDNAYVSDLEDTDIDSQLSKIDQEIANDWWALDAKISEIR